MTERPDWHEYFIGVAKAVSARADCTRRKVGVVVVDEDRRIIATGYNGAHPGGPSCLKGECPRGRRTYAEQPGLVGGYTDCIATHGELNALLFARASVVGTTVYITDPPCFDCKKVLKSCKVKTVVFPSEDGIVVQDVAEMED